MAQLVISAAGAAVGFALGGPTGAQIGWTVGSAVGASINRPKVQGPRLQDLKVGSSEYGTPIPRTYGSPRVPGQIWWASDKREVATTTSQGKGGGPEVTNYTYEVDLLIGLSDNAISAISRIWFNGKLIYNILPTADNATLLASENGTYWTRLQVYAGNATQLPDATYEAAVGASNAIAYRGRGAVFIEGLQLGNSGQLPNLTFELARATDTASSGTTFYAAANFDGVPIGGVSPQEMQATFLGDLTAYVMETWENVPPEDVNNYDIFESPYPVFDGAATMQMIPNDPLREENGISRNRIRNATFQGRYNTTPGGANYITGVTTLRVVFTQPIVAFGFYGMDWGDWSGRYFYELRKDGVVVHSGYMDFGQLDPNSPYEPFEDGDLLFWGFIDTTGQTYDRFDLILEQPNENIFQWDTLGFDDFILGTTAAAAPVCVDLSDVIANQCAAAGLLSNQYNTQNIPRTDAYKVCALAVTQIAAARATLEQLASAYFVECTLRDKLYFRPRAEAPVETIAFCDLAAAQDAPAAEPLALTVASDLELPPQVAVGYANLLDDHQAGTEYSDRLISGQAATQTVQLALGLTPAEAKGIADAIIQEAAASLTSTNIALPLEYAHLEAGDVVTVLDEDATAYRLRLVRKRDESGVLAFEAVADDQSALTSLRVTDETQVPSGTVTALGDTLFEPLDMPILRDAEDGPGWYVAAKGSTTNWPGAQIQASVDDVSFTTVAEVNESAVFGTCTTTLGNYTGVGFDEVTSVTVNVGDGELSSSTRDAMLADGGVNAILIGSEVIRFRTATLSSPGVYVLTGLLRGQRGTEWAMAGHGASEVAVLLRANGLRRVTTQASEIGKLRYVRAVTLGAVASDATSESFTDTGLAITPFSPVDARLDTLLDGSGLTRISWKRRTRLLSTITGPGGISAPLDYTYLPLSSPGSFLTNWVPVPTNNRPTFVIDIYYDAARTNLFCTLYSDHEAAYMETSWLQGYLSESPSLFEDGMLHVSIVHQSTIANIQSQPLYAVLNPLP